MKFNLTYLLILFCLNITAQPTNNSLKILFGAKIFQPVSNPTNARQINYIASTPEFGLAFTPKNKRFLFTLKRSANYSLQGNISIESTNDIFTQYTQIDEFDCFYDLSKNQKGHYLGFGAYNFSFSNLFSGGGFDNNLFGFNLSYRLPLGKYGIEFRKNIQIHPNFALLEYELYSISINRFLGRKKTLQESTKSTFYPVLSLRFHGVKYYEKGNTSYNPIGLSPGIGLAYLWEKYNIEFSISRDFWVRLGGSVNRSAVIGFITTSNFGLRHFCETKNNKKLSAGLFFNPITNKNEFESGLRTRTTYDQSNVLVEVPFIRDTNILGLSASFSYEILDDIDLEFRQIFPVVGDHFFNIWYSSLGVVYRIR